MLYLAFPLRSRSQPVLTPGPEAGNFTVAKLMRLQIRAIIAKCYRRHSSCAAKQLTTRTRSSTRRQDTKILRVNPAFTCKWNFWILIAFVGVRFALLLGFIVMLKCFLFICSSAGATETGLSMVMGYLGFAAEVIFCLMFKGVVKSSIENPFPNTHLMPAAATRNQHN